MLEKDKKSKNGEKDNMDGLEKSKTINDVINPKDDKKPDSSDEDTGLMARFKSEREKRQTVEEELEKFRSKEKIALEKEAEKKGEYDKVLGAYKPKAEKWDQYEKTVKTRIESRLEKLPENRRGIILSLLEKGDVITAEGIMREFDGEKLKSAGGGIPSDNQEQMTEEQLREKLRKVTPQEYQQMKKDGLLDSLLPNNR